MISNKMENINREIELLKSKEVRKTDASETISCECQQKRLTESNDSQEAAVDNNEEIVNDKIIDESNYLITDAINNWEPMTFYADINSALHLQPIVESVEIVPARLTQPLLATYTQTQHNHFENQ